MSLNSNGKKKENDTLGIFQYKKYPAAQIFLNT